MGFGRYVFVPVFNILGIKVVVLYFENRMAGVYDLLSSVFTGRQNWRLKVRVVRVWEMYPIDEPKELFPWRWSW
ncbi:hypothetical protein SESBI_48120 [Sesbania bispinosa]|nr:hypothetical protein SESBI_48120 [Sesbania bispinosa]